MKRKKEAEKAEEREGTVMVRGWDGTLGLLPQYLPAVLVFCCYCIGAANNIHCLVVQDGLSASFLYYRLVC